MRIVEVRAGLLRVPLPSAVRNGTATIAVRDYALVRVRADTGEVGVSCTLTRGGDLSSLVNRVFGPVAVERSVHEPQRVNADMWRAAQPFLGTDGQVARAISLLDLALWDLHARVVGLPIAAVLGAGAIESVPVMAASGYYRSNDPSAELAEISREYAELAERGFTRVKIMAGAVDASFDAERIAAASEASGMSVGVDVNGAWLTTMDADQLLRLLPEETVEFVEEPFAAGQVDVLQRFRQSRRTPVAVGEFECDVKSLRRLMSDGLIDIVRLDATAIGGVTGWLVASALAASYGIPVLPHYYPRYHAPLMAVAPTGLAVEVIPVSSGAENFDLLVDSAPLVEKGRLALSDGPGFGLNWNWQAIESYTARTV
jgi:L-alanine-DL-glutamate epimerase-like enolase superfamily enzyme